MLEVMLSTLERVLALRGAEIFSGLSGESLVPVARVAAEVSFAAGEHLIRREEAGDCLFVIVRGEVDVVVPGAGVVARRGPGACLGEMSVVTSRPRSADCVAVAAVVALRVDRDDFWDVLAERSDLARGLIEALAGRLEEAVGNLRRLSGGAAERS